MWSMSKNNRDVPPLEAATFRNDMPGWLMELMMSSATNGSFRKAAHQYVTCPLAHGARDVMCDEWLAQNGGSLVRRMPAASWSS